MVITARFLIVILKINLQVVVRKSTKCLKHLFLCLLLTKKNKFYHNTKQSNKTKSITV